MEICVSSADLFIDHMEILTIYAMPYQHDENEISEVLDRFMRSIVPALFSACAKLNPIA